MWHGDPAKVVQFIALIAPGHGRRDADQELERSAMKCTVTG